MTASDKDYTVGRRTTDGSVGKTDGTNRLSEDPTDEKGLRLFQLWRP